MKKNQLTMSILFATMLGFTACSDDDKVKSNTCEIMELILKGCKLR